VHKVLIELIIDMFGLRDTRRILFIKRHQKNFVYYDYCYY